MRTRLFAIIASLVVHGALLLPDSHASGTTFWKITSSSATVYLLGSLHVAPPAIFPLPSRIEKAFKNSQYLVVEVNNLPPGDDDGEYSRLIREKGMYREGGSLKDDIPEELYRMLVRGCGEYGLDIERFMIMKPWLAAMSFVQRILQRLGYDTRFGIESYFLSKAKGNKQILELESAEYQYSLFADLPREMQVLLLRQTLTDNAGIKDELKKIVKYWQKGDGEKIEKIGYQSFHNNGEQFAPLYRVVVTERNLLMTETIERYLQTPETYFIVVGTGHLMGGEGIVELLKKKGYHVTNTFE